MHKIPENECRQFSQCVYTVSRQQDLVYIRCFHICLHHKSYGCHDLRSQINIHASEYSRGCYLFVYKINISLTVLVFERPIKILVFQDNDLL